MDKKTDIEIDLMASLAGAGLFRAAQNLREIEDEHPEQFPLIAKLLGMECRDASMLARVARIYKELEIEKARLTSLGWPKLVVLSEHIEYSNKREFLELAEKTTARDLARILSQQPAGTRPVVFYFDDEGYHRLEQSLLAHGARRRRRSWEGLSGKEAALLRMLSSGSD